MANLPSLWSKDPFLTLNDSPFRSIARMQRQMDRLFNDAMNDVTVPALLESDLLEMPEFTPSVDVNETDTHYVMSFDVPGIKKDEIKIELKDNDLVISGERKEEHEQKGVNRYRAERRYGAFQRTFALPKAVKAEQIETDYKDGVLHIAVPKVEASKIQQIKIGQSAPGFWDKVLGHKKDESKKLGTKAA